MKKEEEKVKNTLTKMGLEVTKIKETKDSQTPDFSVTDINNQKYFIEVKTLSTTRIQATSRKDDNAVVSTATYVRNNTFSGKIKTAYEQLESCQLPTSFNLVWLTLQTEDDEFLRKIIRFCFYGIKWVNDSKLSSGKMCFYADYSDFYTFSSVIDGAIISNPKGCEFLLNSISTRYKNLKNSVLVKNFGHAVFDPKYELEKDNYYLSLDPSEPDSKSDMLNKIKEKYNLLNPRFTSINYFMFSKNK